MSRATFPRRWSVVRMYTDPATGDRRAVETCGHLTIAAAVECRDVRRRTYGVGSGRSAFRIRIVPSRWAPRRRIAAWLALELAQRGTQTTRQLIVAGVLPRFLVVAALRDLASAGTIAYEVPADAPAVAKLLLDVGLVDESSEIGRWRLLWNPADVCAAAAVKRGGWTWAVEKPPPHGQEAPVMEN